MSDPVAGGRGGGRDLALPRRDRLLRVLRRRHELRVLLIEAPAGFGRTTLLQQALEQGPARSRDRDHLVVATSTGALSVAETVAAAARDGTEDGAHLAVLVDDAHLAADADTLPELVDALPTDVHLVLSCRLGRLSGAARLVARADAHRLSGRDLALAPAETFAAGSGNEQPADPELAAWPAVAALVAAGGDDLVVAYLQTEVLGDLDERTTQVLSVLATVGGGGPPVVSGLVEAAGGDAVTRRRLAEVPLAGRPDGGCWPHPLWTLAAGDLVDPGLRQAAVALAVDDRLDRRAPAEAGALAVDGHDGGGLRRVVRAALATQPALVAADVLQSWLDGGLLPPEAPERAWATGVVSSQSGLEAVALEQLEAARASFETLGDRESEARVLMQMGALARRTDDFALLLTLIARSGEITEGAGADLAGFRAITEAVAAQIGGDVDAAIAILERVPERALTGDWAAQLHMILATNLAIAGRMEAAIVSFTRATGLGSSASQAVAGDLLAATLWSAGHVDRALEVAEQAEALAERAGVPVTVDLAMATRACLLAFVDDDHAGLHLERLVRRSPVDTEAAALTALAGVLLAVQVGDHEEAVRRLEALPPPTARPTRSKVWRAALEISFLPGALDRWRELAEADRSLRAAVEAGAAGAAHLADGTPVPEAAQPFLPSGWWPRRHPVVHVRLLGGATVERDRIPTEHAAWQRARVARAGVAPRAAAHGRARRRGRRPLAGPRRGRREPEPPRDALPPPRRARSRSGAGPGQRGDRRPCRKAPAGRCGLAAGRRAGARGGGRPGPHRRRRGRRLGHPRRGTTAPGLLGRAPPRWGHDRRVDRAGAPRARRPGAPGDHDRGDPRPRGRRGRAGPRPQSAGGGPRSLGRAGPPDGHRRPPGDRRRRRCPPRRGGHAAPDGRARRRRPGRDRRPRPSRGVATTGLVSEITFRLLTLEDLPLFRSWLLDPDVQVWFRDDDLSIEAITAEYGPRITGEVPEEQWFVLVDGVEAAWIQSYAVADFPDYVEACASVGFDPAGGAIDYLVGRAEDRGRGLGPTVIRAFSEHILARHPAWPGLCSSPSPDNVRSCRALEKAGFRVVGDIVTEDGPERLMARDRPPA